MGLLVKAWFIRGYMESQKLHVKVGYWKDWGYILRWDTGVQGLHVKMGQRRIEFRSLIENVRYKELVPIQMIYPYPQQGNRIGVAGVVVKQVLYLQQDGSLWCKS